MDARAFQFYIMYSQVLLSTFTAEDGSWRKYTKNSNFHTSIRPQPQSKQNQNPAIAPTPKIYQTRQKNTISAQQFYFKDEESVTNGTALQSHLWELEVDLLAGELLVDGAEGLSLVLNVRLLGLVQMHLEQACAVQADPKIVQLRIRTGVIIFYLILFPTISAG